MSRQASLPRMVFTPFARGFRRVIPVGMPRTIPLSPTPLILAATAALQRLELSRDPSKNVAKIRAHKYTLVNTLPLLFLLLTSTYCLYVMTTPSFPLKLAIPILYTTVVMLPITSQLFWPATPVLAWAMLFFCARFIPSQHRPNIHVNLLPALETVLYGANISDLQTRYTNALFDIIAWLPYGVLHFALPVIVALVLWIFGPKGSAQYWGKAFGWMNLLGVVTQILFPCAAPWYEIIHGLTPANYSMPGSPGGLLRIDRVFHSSGYTNAFGSAPLVFGAFPSLHSGCAVMEALFLSHFFPSLKPLYWTYVGVLWWATMYLSHHYLIDLTGGACLSVMVFYVTMPTIFKDVDQIDWSAGTGYELAATSASRDVDFEEEIRKLEEEDGDLGLATTQDEESELESKGKNGPKGKPKRSVSWGETKVMGEESGDMGESSRP